MFAFGPFTLDCARYQLKRNGVAVLVERRVFDLLRYLIEHRDRVVGRDELLERVWSGVSVSPNSLTRAITILRKVLEDDVQEPTWIATTHGRGYRFVGELRAQVERSTIAPASDSALDYRRMVVGRHAEQEALTAALATARRGESSVLLLEGEAGIGKSRLLAWCAEEASRSSVQRIVSRCREDEGAPPLWPWVEVVRTLRVLLAAHSAPLLSRAAPALAHLFPELDALGTRAAPPASESDPRGLRFRAYTALADLLRASAPVALLFDDLHRADTSSIALLEFLAAQLSDAGVLLVGTLRPALGDHEGLARIAREPRCRTLPLRGLAERDVLTLLAAAAPDESSPQLAHEIWEQTGGNAFFVHQVLPLARSGVVPPIARALPRTARKAIEQQCATLSEASLSALRAGAVIGRELSARELAAVIEEPLELTLDALDAAVHAGVLTPEGEALRYRFVHLLVRDVLYEELGSHERSELHARVGTVLEASWSDAPQRASELAYHFSSAQTDSCIEKAIHYHAMAGDFAAARFVYQAAIDHYRTALRLLDGLPEPNAERRCDVLMALARQTFHAGFGMAAAELWLEAAQRARLICSSSRLIRIALDFSATLDAVIQVIAPQRIASLLDEAITATTECTSSERARLGARHAHALELCGDHKAAELASAAALSLARQSGDAQAIADALAFEVQRRNGTPDVHTQAEFAAQVARQAERAGNRSMQFSYLLLQATALCELGMFEPADRLMERHGRLGEEIRSPVHIAVWHQFRAMRALMRGDWSTARPLIQHARGLARHCEPEIFHELGSMNTALEFETAGANAEVLHLLQLAGPGGAWPSFRLYTHQHLGHRELIEQEINAEIERIGTLRTRARLFACVALAEVIAYLRDAERAPVLLEWLRGFEHLHAVINVYSGPVPLAIGTLHKTLEDWLRAFDSLETALRMARQVGSGPFECRALLHLASTHKRRQRRGDAGAARHHATEALHLAEKLAMPHLSRQARRMLASLDG